MAAPLTPTCRLIKQRFGPLIRIEVSERNELKCIKELFKSLQSGSCAEIQIDERRWQLVGLGKLTLRHAKEGSAERLRLKKGSSPPSFEWERDSEGWRDCVALVGGLLQRDRSGYQELAVRTYRSDVAIELSYEKA